MCTHIIHTPKDIATYCSTYTNLHHKSQTHTLNVQAAFPFFLNMDVQPKTTRHWNKSSKIKGEKQNKQIGVSWRRGTLRREDSVANRIENNRCNPRAGEIERKVL